MKKNRSILWDYILKNKKLVLVEYTGLNHFLLNYIHFSLGNNKNYNNYFHH